MRQYLPAILVVFAFFATKLTFGQTDGILIDYVGSVRDNSAVLDVRSTNQGVLVPRLTSAQRLAIASPANGLLVYDTNANTFYYYDSSLPGWSLVSGASGVSTVTANNGLNATTGANPNISLGGALNQNTTVTQGANSMIFDMTGTGDFEVRDNGSSALFIKDDGTVGINTNSPDASAILDIVSSNKGVLIPRMTYAQQQAIPSPANSLLVFNTTSDCLEMYAGGAWQSIYCSCPILDPLQPISGPDPVCSGSTVNFSVPSVTGAADFAWTVSGVSAGNITGNGSNAISFPAPNTSTFTVDVVVSNACFNSSSSQTTTVNAYTSVPPTPTAASAPTSICQGGNYNYSIVNGLGVNGTTAIDYTWTITTTGTATATLTANSQTASSGSPVTYTSTATAVTLNIGSTGSGNVTVSVVGNNTCGSSTIPRTWTVPVNTLSADPTSATASASTICNGQSTTLTLNGGGGGTGEVIRWYSSSCGGTLVGSGNGLSVSPTTTTTYFGRYEDPAPCSYNTVCQAITITVNQPSVAPVSISSTSSSCSGGSITLTATGGVLGTGASYQWGTGSTVGSNILVGETGSTLVVSPTSTTTYWVRIVNTTAPCSANTSGVTRVITVIQPSVAPTNIAGTSPICNGSSTVLTAVGGTLGTGANYQWGTGAIVGSNIIAGQTGSTLTVSPSATTTYWVRIVNTASPCVATTSGVTQVISVNQPSVAPTSISGSSAVCNGSSVTLTASGGSLGTGANYQWGTGSVVGSNVLIGQTGVTLTVSPTTTTSYWVRIVNTSAPCGANTSGVTTTLSINQPSVAPTNITGTTPICSGGSTTLTAVGGTLGTGANYQWGTGAVVGSNIIAGQTGVSINVSPTSTTTYWVRIVNTAAPCPSATGGPTLTVTVNQPSAAPTGISSATSVCNGSSITLTATGATLGTGANYQWGTGSTVGSNVIVGQTGITLIVSPSTTTTYWVRIVNGSSPCAASTAGVTRTISVIEPSVAPTNITGTTPICNGGSTTLTAVGGTLGTGANYQWGTGAVVGSNVIAGQTGSSISVSPTSTTIYWVRIVNTTSPCVATTTGPTLTVTVNQSSSAPTGISGSASVCSGGSVVLTATGGTLGTGANYQWGTGTSIGSNIIAGQTGISLTVSPTSNTTYWVRIVNGSAPCSATTGGVTRLITVRTPSVAPTSISETASTICRGSSVTLTAVGGTLGTGATYQWGTGSTVGSNVIGGATSVNYTPSPSPTTTTTYWVRIVNTTSPCPANTGGVTQTIVVNQPSVAPTSISGTTPICNGSSVTLTAVGGTLGTGATYQWGTGSTVGSNIIGGASSATYTASPTSNTTYWVRIINTTSPCTANTSGVTRTIVVDNFTTANAGPDQSLCATSATLAANSPATGNGVWSVVSGSGSFSSPTSPTTTVSGLGTGSNTFRWTLANGACATSTDNVVITASAPLAAPTSVTASPSTIINGQSSNLSATSPGNTIAWYTSPTGGAPIGTSASGANFSVSPTTTTTYYAEAQPLNSIDYSATFTSGVTPVAQAVAWCNFRSQLLASYSYTSLTVSSQYGSVTITDPAAILGIANALRTSSNYSVNVGGNTWTVSTGCVAGSSPCGGTATVLHMNVGSCSCGSGMFVIRPEINNPNWGGVGTAHCGAPSQTINVSFGIAGTGCTSSTRTARTVTVTQPPASCNHSVSLYDTFGDGWHNNNFIRVYVNGTLVGVYTLPSGSGPATYNFQAATGASIQITFQGGSWPGECYYSVRNGNNQSLVTNWFPNSSGTWNGVGGCP